MSNDAYIPELCNSDFYIEDMDVMYDEEEAHFHHTINEFISLDIDGKLEDALGYILENYPKSWEKLVWFVDDYYEE